MTTSRSQNRRRRVVFDEAIQNAARDASPATDGSSSVRTVRKRKYSHQARQSRPMSDLIPKRWLTVALWSLGMLAALLLLNVLHWTTTLARFPDSPHLSQLLSLDSPQGLGRWSMTACLMLAAGFGCLIFGLRRHRRDDYRGSYRVWMAFVVAALLASVYVSVAWDLVAYELIGSWLSIDWLASDSWAVAWFRSALLALLLVRGLIEVRRSRLTVTFAAIGAVALSVAIWQVPLTEALPWLVDLPGFATNCGLVAVMSCLLSAVSYSRFVCADAMGLRSKSNAERVARRAAKVEKRSAKQQAQRSDSKPATSPPTQPAKQDDNATGSNGRTSKAGLAPLAAKIKASAAASSSKSQPDADEDAEADDDPSGEQPRRLSKSERRRIKRLQQQSRRAA